MEQAWASDSRGGMGVAIAIFPGGILQLMAARDTNPHQKHTNIQHDGSLGSGKIPPRWVPGSVGHA